jgi:hypothetical protein
MPVGVVWAAGLEEVGDFEHLQDATEAGGEQIIGLTTDITLDEGLVIEDESDITIIFNGKSS